MHYGMASLGISVAVIEPGYFRITFLDASAQVKSEKSIKEYDESAMGHVARRWIKWIIISLEMWSRGQRL